MGHAPTPPHRVPGSRRPALRLGPLRLAAVARTMRNQKITFGEMRSDGGPTGIMVYCADHRCSHSVAMSAGQWPDHVRLSDIEPLFVCQACGKRGADVGP